MQESIPSHLFTCPYRLSNTEQTPGENMQKPVLNILCIPALGTLFLAIRHVHRLRCDMMNTKCSSYIPRNTF